MYHAGYVEDIKKRKKQINITQRTQRSQRKEFYFKRQKKTLRPLWALANVVSPAKQVERDRQGVIKNSPVDKL